MWPFNRKPEDRSLQSADRVVEEVLDRAEGTTPEATGLAVVEACMGLWERILASAEVMPATRELEGITPHLLAVMARDLGLRGNFVGLIEVSDGGNVSIQPAASWDVKGETGSWTYRVDLGGPSRTRSVVDAMADQVIHVRIGTDSRRHWEGRSPLENCPATAGLAALIEQSLKREARMPVTRLVATGAVSASQYEDARKGLKKGGIMLARAVGTYDTGRRPAQEVGKLGPGAEATTLNLRNQAGIDILNAYGIPAILLEGTSGDSGQREAWRRFGATFCNSVGRIIEAELRAKLHPDAMLNFDRLRYQDTDGQSRAIGRRASAVKTLVDAGVSLERALEIAEL